MPFVAAIEPGDEEGPRKDVDDDPSCSKDEGVKEPGDKSQEMVGPTEGLIEGVGDNEGEKGEGDQEASVELLGLGILFAHVGTFFGLLLFGEVFEEEGEFVVEPGFVLGWLGEGVAASAVAEAGDVEGFGFIANGDGLGGRVDAVGGPGVGVDEEGGFAFVHEAEGEVAGADGLHDAGDDGGAGALAGDGVGGFGVGEVVMVAEEFADEGAGGDAAAAESFGVDIPFLGLGSDELDGAGAVVCDLAVVGFFVEEGVVAADDGEAGVAEGVDGFAAVFFELGFIAVAEAAAVEEDVDGGRFVFAEGGPEVEDVAFVFGVVFDIADGFRGLGGEEGEGEEEGREVEGRHFGNLRLEGSGGKGKSGERDDWVQCLRRPFFPLMSQ